MIAVIVGATITNVCTITFWPLIVLVVIEVLFPIVLVVIVVAPTIVEISKISWLITIIAELAVNSELIKLPVLDKIASEYILASPWPAPLADSMNIWAIAVLAVFPP